MDSKVRCTAHMRLPSPRSRSHISVVPCLLVESSRRASRGQRYSNTKNACSGSKTLYIFSAFEREAVSSSQHIRATSARPVHIAASPSRGCVQITRLELLPNTCPPPDLTSRSPTCVRLPSALWFRPFYRHFLGLQQDLSTLSRFSQTSVLPCRKCSFHDDVSHFPSLFLPKL